MSPSSNERKLVIYTKIYENAEEDLPKLLDGFKKDSIERLKHLPRDQLPPAEPRIRMLYSESYLLNTLGLFNAAIVDSCILLEALLKEILFFKEGLKKDMTFRDAVKKCEEKGYIDGKDAGWLYMVNDTIRNWYVHSNIEKIAKNIGFEAAFVDIKTGKIKREILFGNKVRAIYDIAKNVLDKKIAMPFFLDVDKFTRKMCLQYFAPKDWKGWAPKRNKS